MIGSSYHMSKMNDPGLGRWVQVSLNNIFQCRSSCVSFQSEGERVISTWWHCLRRLQALWVGGVTSHRTSLPVLSHPSCHHRAFPAQYCVLPANGPHPLLELSKKKKNKNPLSPYVALIKIFLYHSNRKITRHFT